jgi:hypothetical protein
MNNYDVNSCNALERAYYRPIEAALRWCNLIDHEIVILEKTAMRLYPDLADFPQWRCLRVNAEKIVDAIKNEELPYGRDGQTVPAGEQVAAQRMTVRHTDLKKWMDEHYPDQKPKFLFDEVERNTHSAINKDAFIALQADRDSLKTRIDKAEIWAKEHIAKLKDAELKIKDLENKLKANVEPLQVRERETMIKIIHALAKNGYKYPEHGSVKDILSDFERNNNGVVENTLSKYLKEFDTL